jgi:dTDP-4-dehydrorhamnose 3,5-epimerase-like enzyme
MELTKKRIRPAFKDERGAIFDLLDKEKIFHIGMLTSKKGSIRGNHYHKKAKQITYVLSGKIELITKNAEQKDAKPYSLIMEKGDIVDIPPMVCHSIKALEESTLLIFTDEQRGDGGYEDDTHRVEM